MPKPFNVESERNHFALPLLTRQQIKALILDLDMDAKSVIIMAVAQLWQREIGTPDRDLAGELDDLRARLDALNHAQRLAELGEDE